MPGMIELEEALHRVRATPPSGRRETVLIREALGRVLARDVVSPIDSPPFDKSAMDGFAVGPGGDVYRVLETVPAGEEPRRAVRPGECARIMTGAMLPTGATRVIRKEYVEERDGLVRVLRPEGGDNVVRRGSSIRAGERLLEPRILGPREIGILASTGVAAVEVAVPPTTAVLCTGPEIQEAGRPLGGSQIYNSNGPQLLAQLAELHCPSSDAGTVRDEPAALSAALERALASHELVLVTGGVSEGDYDYVPRCLVESGARIIFHGVAIKPGKPTLFARRGESWVFGLPGNPVSTYVVFEVFVKPFLHRRMGLDYTARVVRGRLGQAVARRSTERTELLPVTVRGATVSPVAYHGSADLNALGRADGLIQVPRGVERIEMGAEVDVRLL